MIEIHPLTAVLTAEALIVLVLALVLLSFTAARRKKHEHRHAAALVNRINQIKPAQAAVPAVSSPSATAQLEQVFQEVSTREKVLYRLLIQAFLEHDGALLEQIDQHVSALSEPWRELLERWAEERSRTSVEALQARLEESERALHAVQRENEHLRAQLQAVLHTLDEVTQEYTKMFGATKSGAELEHSLRHVLDALQRIEAAAQLSSPKAP